MPCLPHRLYEIPRLRANEVQVFVLVNDSSPTMDNTIQATWTESNNFQDNILRSDPTKKRKRSAEPSPPRITLETPPSPEVLCEHCLKRDLAKALVKDIDTANRFGPGRWGYFNTWAVDVGHRYRVTRKPNCHLCQMLFASRIDEGDPAFGGDDDFIRAVSYLKFSGLRPAWSDFWGSNDFPFLMLFPNKNYDLSKNKKRIKDHVQISGCAALLQLNKPQTVLLPQQIPPVFDLGTFKNWFGYCKRNHRLLCCSSQTNLRGIRVIDCEEQSIAEYEPGMSYVALSYVWGQPKPQKEVYNGKRLPTQLSSLIRDAMVITQAMGFRYLWVDRYCIDQGDPTVVHHQVRQMGAIYGNAEVTVIAAAGKDENYGLPGVGTNRSATVTIGHIGGVTVLWTPKDPQAAINSSYWSTRGWTFQEAILSRRRLVFTEQQVYFECNAMNIFESLHIPLDSLHIKDRSKSYENLRGGVFGRNRQAEFGKFVLEKQGQAEVFNQYLSNVEEYSARKLTFAEDSLNAFQGIAQQFWYRKQAVHNIWGLSYPTLPAGREPGFVHSLTWCHTTSCWDLLRSPHRRPQFPSWSWAGWEGQVRYKMTSSREKLWFNNLVRAIFFESQTDSPTTLDMITPNPDEACGFPVMSLTTAVIPSNLISFNFNATLDKHWQIGKHKADLALSYGSISESRFAEDVQDSHTWQCVCIGALLKSSFIMILKRHDGSGLWERAGIFILECYSHSLQPIMQKCKYETFRVR